MTPGVRKVCCSDTPVNHTQVFYDCSTFMIFVVFLSTGGKTEFSCSFKSRLAHVSMATVSHVKSAT